MHRRKFLGLAGATLAVGVSPQARSQSQGWPNKPVKLILPYAPGGATDLIGRPWADRLSQAFGQQFVIENRGGAGGMIGTEAAAKATPDGYTFLLTPNATLSVLPNMRQTPYDPVKSFDPVARVGDLVCGFVIHPAVGPKTFKEMIAYAKANPGKLAYGSAGLGTSTHLRIEMLKYRAGIDILHVPYRGSADALNDLLPNTVQMMNEINVIPHVKAGKLILLDINYSERHPDFPDVPTLTELGYPNSDVPIWYSIQAPAGTPKEIITTLNAKVVEIAKTADMKEKMRSINVIVPIQTPEEMSKHLVEDIARNNEVIKAANIKLE
ncbi:MAG TPA: tripartite tricarboxylate transporter substrate binding protein [Hyphomicrobiaceae bacterium]|nr:tripartite tricarboxylate transporter substrate binding protein [Hyphomicrobiaceae bacterium]